MSPEWKIFVTAVGANRVNDSHVTKLGNYIQLNVSMPNNCSYHECWISLIAIFAQHMQVYDGNIFLPCMRKLILLHIMTY